MGLHRLKKGLSLPISGLPEQRIEDARAPGSVAIMAADFPGMKPAMKVAVGDAVELGQPLFEDKKQPGVLHTSPGTGKVTAIHRAAKRALISVVVRLDSADAESGRSFAAHTGQHPSSLDRQKVRDLLLESGLWTAIRARPFGRVAAPDAVPRSVFVTAMDSNPLAPDLEVAFQGRESDFERGMHALSKLTDGPVYLCRAPGSKITPPSGDRFRAEEFAGPHPSGTVGAHIHTLDPASRNRLVWYVGLQDVLAIGKLFETGRIDTARVVALGGPSVVRPRLLRTRIGAAIDPLVEGELETVPPPAIGSSGNGSHGHGIEHSGEPPRAHRVVSGSVFSGRAAMGDQYGYLGRYHQQLVALPEDPSRQFLGWLAPGAREFSTVNLFLSKVLPKKRFDLTTSTHGSPRAIVPIGLYEKVMPFDLQPTYLLKALVMGDVERAEELGCLELEEEDVALCTFVCPGKTDYGPYLRKTLTILEKEG